jgi:hypothetical protein
MFAGKRIQELTERLHRADGIAAERGDIIATLDRRLQDMDRVRLAQAKELRAAYAENARLRQQREELADHLKHAVDERNAAEGALDVVITGGPEKPFPRLTTTNYCPRCKGSRKQDAGEDEHGVVEIPCEACCCHVCGEVTGGGMCETCKEPK